MFRLTKEFIVFVRFSCLIALFFSQGAIADSLNWSNWVTGSQGSATLVVNDSDNSVSATYPAGSSGVHAWGTYKIASEESFEVYVDFMARMPGNKYGFKFLKIFGVNNGGYANTTFGLDYAGVDNGALRAVSFGDGSSDKNDTQNIILLNGANKSYIGRSYGVATVETPQNSPFRSTDWGEGWHHFKMYMKFNSGDSMSNEISNGRYYLEIDGKAYVQASGLLNRHYSNGYIDRVEILGWAPSSTYSYQVDYKDVHVSTSSFKNGSKWNEPAPSVVTDLQAVIAGSN